MKRNPREDPIAGDIIENPYGRHTVLCVIDGIVHYNDEGLKDHVPIEKWRAWYIGDKKSKVVRAAGG